MVKRRKSVSGLPGGVGRQSYHDLRARCLQTGQKFVDVSFPPENSSLFLDADRSSDIVWKRPGELIDDPKLFVEGASPNDVTQGILGNCWFVSACSALTHNEELLKQVIPDSAHQEWDPSNPYCGIFRFRFWRFGGWIEVVIDDLLPTKDGQLLFARSKTPNEFWSALLEKAFAKLYGCYENLVGGQLSDALQDVSGGVAETINVKKFLAQSEDGRDRDFRLFQVLHDAFNQKALIVAAIAAKNKEDIEKSLRCGLVKGHAYAVTMVRYIELTAKKKTTSLFGLFGNNNETRVAMIRLQNPWGEKEWNGPWSDHDARWEQVTEEQKAELGMTVDEDGEFWMPWEEFVKYFTDISVCQLFNTGCITAFGVFNEYVFFDEWTTNGVKCGAPKDRAGGCQNFAATFCFNPQYKLEVDEDDSELMIALTQKEVISEGAKTREPYVTIGLHVMRVELNRKCRIHQAINAVATSDYASVRSVYLHLRGVARGRYILMPTTYAPREQAQYMLRIYSKHHSRPELLLRDFPPPRLFSCSKLNSVTRIVVQEASLHSELSGTIHVVVRSGRERSKGPPRPAGLSIVFDDAFVFHGVAPRQSYFLELWHQPEDAKTARLLGQCTLASLVENDTRTSLLDVQSREATKANPAKTRLGVLKVEECAYDDPMYL